MNVFFSGTNLSKLETDANNWLHELSKWLDVNELELNTNKTKYVVFRARNVLANNITLHFRNDVIERVDSIRFLGVLFHEHLSWNTHINYLKFKLSRVIGAFWKIRNQIPRKFRALLYFSMIHSHIYYCLLIWGTTTVSNIENIFIAQKKVRALEGLKHNESTQSFRECHGILMVDPLYKHKLATYMHSEIKKGRQSFELSFMVRNQIFDLRTIQYRVPKLRTNYGEQSLRYQIPKLLNENKDLITIIERHSSIAPFKGALAGTMLL